MQAGRQPRILEMIKIGRLRQRGRAQIADTMLAAGQR
jgi:hypothetical protein